MIQSYYPVINKVDSSVLECFNKRYPSFMLQYYLNNNGKNILIPLFSANYNKCLELLYKAGMIVLSENFKDIKNNNKLVLYKNNIKEIFGLPVKTLKRLVDEHNIGFNKFINVLSEIYDYNKNILDVNYISNLSARFLIENNITHKEKFERFYTTLDCVNTWTDEEVIKTIKYLNKLQERGKYTSYNIYSDYIEICEKLKDFVCGKWPKDLNYAHDLASAKYEFKKNKYLEDKFKEAVNDYKYLSSIKGDDVKNFEEDKYIIIVPKSGMDLIRESNQLHHCVKTYIDKVANKRTFILLVREKENKDKSLATIEVLPNKTLIQLKAISNSKASKEVQDFVRKWAEIKGITINTYDM